MKDESDILRGLPLIAVAFCHSIILFDERVVAVIVPSEPILFYAIVLCICVYFNLLLLLVGLGFIFRFLRRNFCEEVKKES